MNYDFNEHRHRYSIWTTSRAVQRGFVNTSIIASTIEKTSLKQFCESIPDINQNEFDRQQKKWCKLIIRLIGKQCTYGRAAKMVAVYLKTSLILPHNANFPIDLLIHP